MIKSNDKRINLILKIGEITEPSKSKAIVLTTILTGCLIFPPIFTNAWQFGMTYTDIKSNKIRFQNNKTGGENTIEHTKNILSSLSTSTQDKIYINQGIKVACYLYEVFNPKEKEQTKYK